jgi:hypothetical protein
MHISSIGLRALAPIGVKSLTINYAHANMPRDAKSTEFAAAIVEAAAKATHLSVSKFDREPGYPNFLHVEALLRYLATGAPNLKRLKLVSENDIDDGAFYVDLVACLTTATFSLKSLTVGGHMLMREDYHVLHKGFSDDLSAALTRHPLIAITLPFDKEGFSPNSLYRKLSLSMFSAIVAGVPALQVLALPFKPY